MILHDIASLKNVIREFKGISALSFDIFDTIISRSIDPPEKIKRCVSEYAVRELLLPISLKDFYSLRKKVEHEICSLSKNNGLDGECRLTDVCRVISDRMGLDNECVDKLLACELEVEKTYSAIIPETKTLIKQLASNHNLIAVSDTYLPVWMLRELLKHHGLDGFFSNVYASCEYGLSKGSGRLFIKVLEQEGLAPADLLHIGDNFLGDYFSPRSLGIRSILSRDRKNLRRKARLAALNKLEARFPSWQSMAFAERLSSVREPITDSNKDQFYKWGRVVVGPLLCNYTHLLGVELARSGHDLVFFIAREGYLLKKLYELFSRELFERPLPKARYLCVSRYTAFLASLHDGLGDREIDIALSEYRVTPQAALTRFGISEQSEITRLLEKYRMVGNAAFSKEELTRFLLRVLEDGVGRDCIQDQSVKMRAGLAAYLKEEGFFSAGNVALADVGWFGGIQDGLEKAFSDRQDTPHMRGYYLALEGSNLYSGCNKTGLVHDFRNPTPDGTSLGFFKLAFEFSCRGLHGTTIGYEEGIGGRVLPLFKRDDHEKAGNPAIAAVQRGVLNCALHYVQLMKVERVDPILLRAALMSNYDRRISFPDPALAEAFSSVINTEDFGSDRTKRIADAFCLWDVFNPRIALKKIIETPWREVLILKLPLPGILHLFHLVKRLLAWRKMWVHLREAGDDTLAELARGVLGRILSCYRIILGLRFPFHVLKCLFITAGLIRNSLESLLIFLLKPLPPSYAVSAIIFLARIKESFLSPGRSRMQDSGSVDVK